jgi:hypothetical protein
MLFLLVFRLYMALYCSFAFPDFCSSYAEIGYIINNNFAVEKKFICVLQVLAKTSWEEMRFPFSQLIPFCRDIYQ